MKDAFNLVDIITITLLFSIGVNVAFADNVESRCVDVDTFGTDADYEPPLPLLSPSSFVYPPFSPHLFEDDNVSETTEVVDDADSPDQVLLHNYLDGLPCTSYQPLRCADLYRNNQQLDMARQHCRQACPDSWLDEGVYIAPRTVAPPELSVEGLCQICRDHFHQWRPLVLLIGLEYDDIKEIWLGEQNDEACFRTALNLAQEKGLLNCTNLLPAIQLIMGDLICFAVADCYFDPYLISSPLFKGFSHCLDWPLKNVQQGALIAQSIALHGGLDFCKSSEELRLLALCMECRGHYIERLLAESERMQRMPILLYCLLVYMEREGKRLDQFIYVVERLQLQCRNDLREIDRKQSDILDEYDHSLLLNHIPVASLFPSACTTSGDPETIYCQELECCHISILLERFGISPALFSQVIGCYDIWRDLEVDSSGLGWKEKIRRLIQGSLNRNHKITVRNILDTFCHPEVQDYTAANSLMDALTGSPRKGSLGQQLISGESLFEETRHYLDKLKVSGLVSDDGDFDVMLYGEKFGFPRYQLDRIQRYYNKKQRVVRFWKLCCQQEMVSSNSLKKVFTELPADFWHGITEYHSHLVFRSKCLLKQQPDGGLPLTVNHCAGLKLSHLWQLLCLCLGIPVEDIVDIRKNYHTDRECLLAAINKIECVWNGSVEMGHLYKTVQFLQSYDPLLTCLHGSALRPPSVPLSHIIPAARLNKGKLLVQLALRLREHEEDLIAALGLNTYTTPFLPVKRIPEAIDVILVWEIMHPGSIDRLWERYSGCYQVNTQGEFELLLNGEIDGSDFAVEVADTLKNLGS
ncbi:hypothetical protein [Spongorhabdus nitratireducens]